MISTSYFVLWDVADGRSNNYAEFCSKWEIIGNRTVCKGPTFFDIDHSDCMFDFITKIKRIGSQILAFRRTKK